MRSVYVCYFLICILASFACVAEALESKVLYEELVPNEFRHRISEAPIAYIPLGTLEWHGEHLPLGADGLQSKGFFEILAREIGGIVLPMMFLGPDAIEVVDDFEYYGMGTTKHARGDSFQYPRQQLTGSAYWIPDSTFIEIAEATIKQLKRAGFKIVVMHGHGPSTGMCARHFEKWQEKYNMHFYNCWGSEYDGQGLGIMVDHAASNETSLLMALRPELVQMHNLPADTSIWPVGISGTDPRLHASAEMGWKAIHLQKERMVAILRQALADRAE